LEPKQHFTEPPPRFTESTIIKEMEQNGIGRPSTYAQIISTLLDRKYVERETRKLFPTELGITVNRILVREFPDIFTIEFTAQMEEELDGIEMGKKWVQVIEDFYGPFQRSLETANSRKEEIRKSATQALDEKCPECGNPLMVRWSRTGKFIGCTGFPKCRYTRPVEESKTPVPTPVDKKCPKCGSQLQVKRGRYGMFLGCSNYPKCRHVESMDTGVPCPKEGCNGKIVKRRSKKGRPFYGCTNYPKCDFISSYPLVAETCTNCGFPVVQVVDSKSGSYRKCPNCKTKITTDEATEITENE